jgi:predicted ATPase
MATPHLLTFGALLKRHRRAAHLTQEQLAVRAGYSASYLSQLERGEREPAPSTADLLAESLALDPHARASLLATIRQQRRRGASVPTLSGSIRPPFVGRARELAWLESHLGGAGPSILLLTGEPGIGKSRLLQETNERARAGGWQILEGGCSRRSSQEPYAPMVGALASYLGGRQQGQLRSELEGCSWLVRLLPELAETTLVPSPSWLLPPDQERRLMFAAVRRVLANVAGPTGTLLLLDDLQWAGADVLDLLASLVRTAGSAPVRMVGAYRDTDVQPEDPLSVWLADLARDGLVGRTQLGPLAHDEASELLNGLLGESLQASALDAARRAQVLMRADGIPFFLVSCAVGLHVGAWEADPADSLGDGRVQVAIPWTVAQSLNQRVAALPDHGRVVLEIAAVGGRSVHRSVLEAIGTELGLDAHAVLTGLEVSGRARLLEEEGEQAYQLAHDLIRDAVLAELSSARRALLHGLIARALEHEAGEPPVEALAYHYLRSGGLDHAAIYLKRAGDRAWSMHANAEAEANYRELVGTLERLGRLPEAAQARLKLGLVLTTMARYDQALVVLEQAVEDFQILGDQEGLGRTIAQIGETYAVRGTSEEGIARLHQVVTMVSNRVSPRTLASLYTALSQLYSLSGHHREQVTAAERAAELARDVNDERLLSLAEKARGTALLMLGHNEDGRRVLEDVIPLLEVAGDSRSLAFALNNLAVAYEARGEFEQDRAYVERALEVAERMRDPTVISFMLRRRGVTAFYLGHWAVARVDYERAYDIIRQSDPSWTSAYPPLALGELNLAVGEWEAAERFLQDSIAKAERTGDLQALQLAHTALAERELLWGNAAAARARLDPLLDRCEHRIEVTILLPPLAWAYLQLGDFAQARALVTQATHLAASEQNRFDLVAVRRVEAQLALGQGRLQDAEAAIEESLSLSRSMPYPYGESKALYVSGQLHIAKDEPERARERFERALVICGQLGERLYAEHIEQTLAAL